MMRFTSALCLLTQAVSEDPIHFGNIRGSMLLKAPHADVSKAVAGEMEDNHHVLSQLETALEPLFKTLPKNPQGKVNHAHVRLGLHRFFAGRHGWHLAGLLGRESSEGELTVAEDVQKTFENEHIDGADLRGMAVLAATLEDLVKEEVRHQLKMAYKIEQLQPEQLITRDDAERVIFTSFMTFSGEHRLNLSSTAQLTRVKRNFKIQYIGNKDILEWVGGIADAHISEDRDSLVSFESIADVAMEVAREFHKINSGECKKLETVLQGLESKKPGRVWLSKFYASGLDTASLWRFNEAPEYLRAMGVLDETHPGRSYLILANYMLAERNCLRSSAIYSVCCRNICGDVRSQIEKDIGQPTASAERIANLIVNMPSEIQGAPVVAFDGALPALLRSRLDEIASLNKGEVFLSGRLFTQWLHHVYPLDCPFPQAVDIDHKALNGFEVLSTSEELQEYVDGEACSVNSEGNPDCAESADLPWSLVDSDNDVEVFVQALPASAEPTYQIAVSLGLIILVVLLTPLFKGTSMAATWPKIRALLVLATVANGVGLLNQKIFVLSFFGGISSLLISSLLGKKDQGKYLLPKTV